MGFKFLDKSYIVSRHLTDTEIIHEALLDLSRDIPETIYYAILSQNSAIYLDAVFPSPSRFMPFVNGITAPLYCTGLGKALLSMCEDSFIKSVMLESDIKRFTDTTITDYEEMKKEIAITRKRGYSIDNMEHEYGVKCVSVPILDRKGNLNGAISASGPSLRFTDDIIEKYAELLIKTASELKNKL